MHVYDITLWYLIQVWFLLYNPITISEMSWCVTFMHFRWRFFYIGLEKGCEDRKPDLILLNSGLHDRNFTTYTFSEKLSEFFDILKTGYGSLAPSAIVPRVLWKSDLLGCRNADNKAADIWALDSAAYTVTSKYNIPFVNITDVLKYVPRYSQRYVGHRFLSPLLIPFFHPALRLTNGWILWSSTLVTAYTMAP
jgi:hypothetical protein